MRPDLVSLVEKLLEKTLSDSIAWQATEDSAAFQVSFKSSSVRIGAAYSFNGTDYYVTVFNAVGNVIESFSDSDLRELTEAAFHMMKELHSAARNNALGVNKAIADILNELK